MGNVLVFVIPWQRLLIPSQFPYTRASVFLITFLLAAMEGVESGLWGEAALGFWAQGASTFLSPLQSTSKYDVICPHREPTPQLCLAISQGYSS